MTRSACHVLQLLVVALLLHAATGSRIEIHRQPTCAFATLWDVNFKTIASVEALEQTATTRQEHDAEGECAEGKGPDGEPCWRKDNVQLVEGKLELHAASTGKSAAKIRFEKRLNTTTAHNGVNHVRVFAKFPEGNDNAKAVVTVHVLPLDVHMSIGLLPKWAKQNHQVVWLASSQNTSVVAEIPCLKDVRSHFHDLEFAWDSKWLRWHLDDSVIYEEPVRGSGIAEGSKTSGGSVSVEFTYSIALPASNEQDEDATTAEEEEIADSRFLVEKIQLKQGDAVDAACGPRHRTNANCRDKTLFAPRFGANQGSLSSDEIAMFLNETVARFPPQFTRLETIGRSVQGRPIYALCIGACENAAGEQEDVIPQALYTGMHHAREPISMMNQVYTIDLLLLDFENGDLDVLHLLFSRQLWFVLVVNPDGYVRNEDQRIWETSAKGVGQRKNTRPGCNTVLENGVDLNRNYDVCFDHDSVGSSTDICAEDYRGSKPFSEPETQAIRDFVARPGMNFSTALNYHSYGRYFNIPFACQANGVPAPEHLAVFQAIAKEMTTYNHFTYGQPWKESNLYSVNGETSDWMWQTHGIFAMSPEVGPSFDVPDTHGFWPQRDQVPSLSAELHYSNLYAAKMAGPLYAFHVANVRIEDDSTVALNVSLSNAGLRAVGNVELIASMFANGSYGSDLVDILASEIGTAEAKQTVWKTLKVPRRLVNPAHHVQIPVYVVLRDMYGCQLHRIAIDYESASGSRREASFQVWDQLSLPPCGICATFGSAHASSPMKTQDAKCTGLEDVTMPHAIRLKRVADATKHSSSAPKPTPPAEAATTSAPEPPEGHKERTGDDTETSGDDAESNVESENAPTTKPLASSPVSTPAASSSHSPAPVASPVASAAQTSDPVFLSSDSDFTTSSWFPVSTPFYAMPILALLVFVLLAIVFCCRRRRASRNNSELPRTTRKSHSKKQYSRVVNDEVTPSRDDGSDDEFGGGFDDSDEEAEGTLGRVRSPFSPTRRSGGQSSPTRRPGSPKKKPTQYTDIAV
uniref:Peptidase M14 domain-containing protein n=1 Tax=Globisporangium ultimum (strain ATCC 200006 / CBS 805.95 / DAOM BR144) TaxID=431595 RepID=K3W8L7_GLOUD